NFARLPYGHCDPFGVHGAGVGGQATAAGTATMAKAARPPMMNFLICFRCFLSRGDAESVADPVRGWLSSRHRRTQRGPRALAPMPRGALAIVAAAPPERVVILSVTSGAFDRGGVGDRRRVVGLQTAAATGLLPPRWCWRCWRAQLPGWGWVLSQ